MGNISQSKLSHNGNLNDIIFKSKFDSSEQGYVQIFPKDFTIEKTYDLIIALHGHGSDRWQFASDTRDECKAFRDFAVKQKMIALSPDYRAKTSWMGPIAEKEKRSAELHANRLTMPVAFTIGGEDIDVPPESVLRLAKKLQKINKNTLMINRPNSGHSTNYKDAISAMEFMCKASNQP